MCHYYFPHAKTPRRKVLLLNAVISIEQDELAVGAASSRDHLIWRLEAAPTTGFLW